MKHTKRLLSTLLAIVMLISATSVGFYAFAQDGEQTAPDPVAAAEQAIDDWYDNHRNNMYPTKDPDPDKIAAARSAYDAVNDQIKALSESQVLSMDLAHYAYWMTNVLIDVTRNMSKDPSKSPATADKCKVMQNNIADIESLVGAFPEEYKTVIDAYQVFNIKAGSYYLGNTSNQDFKKADMLALLEQFIASVKTFTYRGYLFSDYLAVNSTGGFYFNTTSIKASSGITAGNIIKYLYNKNQDLTTQTGKDPVAPKYGDYVTRSGSYKEGYTYSYKSEDSPQKYLNDFDAYFAAYQTDVVDVAAKAYEEYLYITDSIDELKNIREIYNAIYSAGSKIIKEETVTDDEVRNAVAMYNALTDAARSHFDSIAGKTESKLLPYVRNPHTLDELTPELLYSKSSSVATYKLSDLVKQCQNFANNLLLEEFEQYVANINLEDKNAAIIKTAQQKYAILPSDFKSKITAPIFEKFTELVKPEKNPSNMSDQIKTFKKTTVVLPKDNCPLGSQKGGIQIAVDDLWKLVAETVLPFVTEKVDLSDGLDKTLEENVYTNAMVAKIFSLYATLSHNETVVVTSPLTLTLGTVVGMIASPSTIAKLLEEEKFADAVAKIKPYNDFKDTATQNKFDALAAQEFVNGDFGFKDGDREGFFDALLAVLRPITTLLAPGAKAAGLIALGVNMFDHVNDQGVYTGVYSELIPLLEQIGLTSLPTADEYKTNYENKVKSASKNIAADELLRPIINALLTDVLDMVSPSPLNGIIKLLPRIAYVLSTDMLNTKVKSALSNMGMLSGLAGSLDLSTEAINNMIFGKPIDLSSLVGTKCSITLKPADWNKLANCATVKAMPSASNTNAYFVLRTGDTETCFTTVFYYIHAVVFADKNNYEAIKGLINSALGSIGGIVTGITDGFAEVNNIEAYKKLLNFIQAPPIDVPEIKVDIPDLSGTKKSTVNASKCTIKLSKTSYTYDGKTHKPSVTVKYKGKKLNAGTDYKVTYIGGCKDTGKYGVTVSFKGKYSGSKNLYFTINPKNTSIKSVTKGKKSFTIKWKKKTSQITGYQIQYSTNKNFKKAKTVTISSASSTSKKIKSLKGKKKYYVRIRTYKNFAGAKAYSSWSKAKTVVTK